ncbi:unnamed protein product, partial [Effrenium voratum]
MAESPSTATAVHGDSWKRLSLDEDAPESAAPKKRQRASVSTPCSLSKPAKVSAPSQPAAPQKVVNITAAMLRLLPKEDSVGNEGQDRAVQMSGGCRCKRNCVKQFHESETLNLASLWHGLSVQTRVGVLSGLYHGDSEDVAACSEGDDRQQEREIERHHWKLNDKQVCFRGFCQLLGVSAKTVCRMIHGAPDMRVGEHQPGTRSHPQRDFINYFFTELYLCAAEDLPEVAVTEGVDAAIEQGLQAEVTTEESPEFKKHFVWNLQTEVPARLTALLITDSGQKPPPCRMLPPGKLSDLWYQFLAWSESHEVQDRTEDLKSVRKSSKRGDEKNVPSWATFWRVWNTYWHGKSRTLLAFRKQSQHAECDVCAHARMCLYGKNMSVNDKIHLATAWRQHLRDQYHDRQLYWSMRFASRSKMNIITIIVDSFDKTKMAYPKLDYKLGRLPHAFDQLLRPKLVQSSVLTACLCHGWRTGVFLQDDHLRHGADAYLEVVSRTLDSIATTTGELPAHLWLQSDNTTAQSKNSSSHLYCALLVGRRQMSTVTCSYLTKGHTHEDVDHFFGELLPILRRNHFECLEDMQQLLQKVQVRAENCQEQLQVETMTAIHDFTGWMDVTGVRLMNTFRSRKKQPQERCAIPAHSFTYKRREDLSASEREQLPASTAQGHAQDVFAIIKARMHHGHDQAKPPVLTLPWDRASRVGAFSQVPTLPPNDIAEDKKKKYIALAALLEKEPYNYQRGPQALRELARDQCKSELRPIPWLDVPGAQQSANVVFTGNHYYPELAE